VFRTLLRAAGFTLSRVVPAARSLCVVEGLPA